MSITISLMKIKSKLHRITHIWSTSREAAADTCGLPLLNRSLQNVYLRASLVKRVSNWFKLAHGIFWVRCTFEKTAGFWQKWTPERSKSKCFHSLWVNFWRKKSKNVQIGSLHLLGAVYFRESGWFLTKVDVQEAKIKMLPFYVRLVSIGSRCLLGALYLWENGWFFDKSGRPRGQNQISFILCESIYAEEVCSNLFIVSFRFAVPSTTGPVFLKSRCPRGQFFANWMNSSS